MTHEEYMAAFDKVLVRMRDTTCRKNADYGEAADAFANFRLIQELTGGRITMQDGILVRMTDKLARLVHLSARDAQVKDEAFADTAEDLAVYAAILALMRAAPQNQP
jgi:hypothetical protein